jgi:hypothetical protein
MWSAWRWSVCARVIHRRFYCRIYRKLEPWLVGWQRHLPASRGWRRPAALAGFLYLAGHQSPPLPTFFHSKQPTFLTTL